MLFFQGADAINKPSRSWKKKSISESQAYNLYGTLQLLV
jgi:hypothetical protein